MSLSSDIRISSIEFLNAFLLRSYSAISSLLTTPSPKRPRSLKTCMGLSWGLKPVASAAASASSASFRLLLEPPLLCGLAKVVGTTSEGPGPSLVGRLGSLGTHMGPSAVWTNRPVPGCPSSPAGTVNVPGAGVKVSLPWPPISPVSPSRPSSAFAASMASRTFSNPLSM